MSNYLTIPFVFGLIGLSISLHANSPLHTVNPHAKAPLTLSEALNIAATGTEYPKELSLVTHSQMEAMSVSIVPSPSFGASAGVGPSESLPTEFQTGAIITLPINLPGMKMANQAIRNSAVAMDTSAIASLSILTLQTQKDVVNAFFAVGMDQAVRDSDLRTLNLANKSLAVAQNRFQVGSAPQLDVIRARSAVETAEATLAQSVSALQGDRYILSTWLGDTSFGDVLLPTTPFTLPNVTQVLKMAENSPDVKLADATTSASTASLEGARAALFPSVAIGAGVESRAGTVGPVVFVNLSLPLGTGLLKAKIQSADAAQMAARSAQEKARQISRAHYLSDYSTSQSDIALLPDLETADQDAQKVAQDDLAAYNLGAVPSSELILAQQEAAVTHSAWVTAKVAAARAIALLQIDLNLAPNQ